MSLGNPFLSENDPTLTSLKTTQQRKGREGVCDERFLQDNEKISKVDQQNKCSQTLCFLT